MQLATGTHTKSEEPYHTLGVPNTYATASVYVISVYLSRKLERPLFMQVAYMPFWL